MKPIEKLVTYCSDEIVRLGKSHIALKRPFAIEKIGDSWYSCRDVATSTDYLEFYTNSRYFCLRTQSFAKGFADAESAFSTFEAFVRDYDSPD